MAQDPAITQARFDTFDANHPEVWHYFVQFAKQLLDAGQTRGSAEQIIQRIRWEIDVNKKRDEGFKINNYFRSYYAKKLKATDPQFATFFETRTRRKVVYPMEVLPGAIA